MYNRRQMHFSFFLIVRKFDQLQALNPTLNKSFFYFLALIWGRSLHGHLQNIVSGVSIWIFLVAIIK